MSPTSRLTEREYAPVASNVGLKTMNYKSEHAARALEIVESLLPYVAPHEEYTILLAILRDRRRWKEAHDIFDRIRINITLPYERQEKQDLDTCFAHVAECAAKTVYNCSGEPAPFDDSSFERLLRSEQTFRTQLTRTGQKKRND